MQNYWQSLKFCFLDVCDVPPPKNELSLQNFSPMNVVMRKNHLGRKVKQLLSPLFIGYVSDSWATTSPIDKSGFSLQIRQDKMGQPKSGDLQVQH